MGWTNAQNITDSVATTIQPKIKGDTLIQISDTTNITLQSDTLLPQKSNSVISSEITYSAKDSIDNDVVHKKVYLYGDAKIQYQDITLTAARIVYDFENYTVHAEGVKDTADNWIGLPNFIQGTSNFNAMEMDYNFRSKKAYVKQVQTEVIEGTLTGNRVKTTDDNNVIYIRHGEYCPCEDPNAKTRFKIGKLKVIKDKQIVTGPGYMAIGKIPTPIAFPFGFFPNTEDKQAGIIIPSYGNGGNQGYFLNNLGFYYPINDYVDTKILGDIYTRGTWGLKNITRYTKRYKFTGDFNIEYFNRVLGDKDLFTYSRTNSFFVRWSHAQDQRAKPNSNFSASVNAGSTSNYRNDINASHQDYLTNTFQSSITYNKSFYDSPWTVGVRLGHSQNSQTGNFTFTLPDVTINRARTMPLAGLFNTGTKQKFYEKLGLTYSSTFRNQLDVHESQLAFDNWPQLKKEFNNGMQHNAGLSLPLKAGPLTITPSFNYTERWYFKTYGQTYNEELSVFEQDTILGFDRNYNYNFSTSVSTKVYGMFSFKKGKLQAIRHTITPSISYRASPTFDPNIYGYFGEEGNFTRFSPYSNSIYSFSGSERSESINFTLGNNLEAKVLSRRDSTSKFKKIPIIENLTISGGYNFAADSLKLSMLNVSGRTKITKYANLNFSGRFEPYSYAIDSDGRIGRRDVFLRQSSNKWASFEGGNLSINGSGFGSEMYANRKTRAKTAAPAVEEDENAAGEFQPGAISQPRQPKSNPNQGWFENFTVPWHFNFGYTLNAMRHRYRVETDGEYFIGDSISIVQGLTFSGDVKLFNKIYITFNSGYDFIKNEFTPTTIFMTVDLNCWEFSARVIPFGDRKSYNLALNIKSSMLKDLKLEKKGRFTDENKFYH